MTFMNYPAGQPNAQQQQAKKSRNNLESSKPKKKKVQQAKTRREQDSKIKGIFNQVLKINKLTIQPIFNNIVI
jgi:hypothetical protein